MIKVIKAYLTYLGFIEFRCFIFFYLLHLYYFLEHLYFLFLFRIKVHAQLKVFDDHNF